MLAVIKDNIAKKLATSPVPVIAAVIYGSWARGQQIEDSDVDMLIISNAINPKKHKRGEEIACMKDWLSLGIPLDILLLTADECISNFRNHNPLFLDIVLEGIILIDKGDFLKNLIEETLTYIRQKGIEKLSDGWRFPMLYRKPTFLSNVSNMDFAIVMLTDGERDFKVGMNIMKDGYFDKAVYHFQQAVEKAIKAVLISFGEFKKTHFVGEILIEKLKEIELESKWKETLIHVARISEEVEPEVTWSRYPGIDSGVLWIPYEEYTADDAQEIKEKSEEVIKAVKDFIEWWFRL